MASRLPDHFHKFFRHIPRHHRHHYYFYLSQPHHSPQTNNFPCHHKQSQRKNHSFIHSHFHNHNHNHNHNHTYKYSMSSSTKNIQIVGESKIVVQHDGLTIRECIGNVASSSHDDRDALSLALVSISQPASEPWLTIQYDEYLHVTDGKIHIHHFENSADSEEILTVSAGQTVLIRKGTRFRPVFPVGNTKYIPLCLPAFSPERCRREDDAGDEAIRNVVDNLQSLHDRSGNNNDSSNSSSSIGNMGNAKYDDIRKIYHMCQKSLWEESASKSRAYFPPTFHKDGKFTHATAVPERLIQTANHFYTDTTGDWICLELDRWELEKTCGIVTVFEEAMPVGERETGRDWSDWVCPHIYGGIPTHLTGIVTNIFDMKRSEDGKFLSIEGLAE